MTVVQFNEKMRDGVYDCDWFDGPTRKHDWFRPEVLEAVPDQTSQSVPPDDHWSP